jgi:hypothetical protein
MDTLKKANIIGLVVALVVLASAVPASAQFRRDPLTQVMNQNMALTCMGPGTVWFDRIGCVRFSSGQYWLMQDQYGRRLSRPVKIALGTAAGATIGNIVSRGSTKGTIIGAVIGGVATYAVTRSRGRDKDEPMVIDEGQQVRIAHDGVPVAVGRPVAPQSAYAGYQTVASSAPTGPRWQIRNMTGGKGELFDGDRFVKVMEPGETYSVANPQGGYQLMILVPTEQGTLETREAVRKPRRDGWDMEAPSIQ